MTKKASIQRPYPPDFVRLKTLAYRLDLAERTVQDYVSTGILPGPTMCGNVKLWRWADIEAHLAKTDENDNDAPADIDEYDLGVMRLAKEKADDRAA